MDQLAAHAEQLRQTHLLSLFENDPQRASDFCLALEASPSTLRLDFSKHFCQRETLAAFSQLCEQMHLREAIDALMSGAPVNPSEQRAALHTALRSRAPDAPHADTVRAVQQQMQQLSESLAGGHLRGYDGDTITDVINIGIGGSDLGPRMVVTALKPYTRSHLRCHFVSNIDPCDLADTLRPLNPARTLVIIASKSFTTLETLENGTAAKNWLQQAAGDKAIGRQLVAVTAKPERARQFGVDAANIFPMWDWVGGRFSLWSAIGLPIAIATGWEHFRALLDGAAAMDQHYAEQPPARNMPALMALLECFYIRYWGARSAAVLPYSHRLRLFPAFLQQLCMESLGKGVTLDGAPVIGDTGAVIWGEPGTNGQHSFHQLLHQGTPFIPADFIAVCRSDNPIGDQQAHLVANCLSQSRALMVGKPLAEVEQELRDAGLAPGQIAQLAPHKVIPGNRPSSTLLIDTLTPFDLGALIALYEHKVHCQSVIWQINAFDQWGVELGKQLSQQIYPALQAGAENRFDPSTRALIERYRSGQN